MCRKRVVRGSWQLIERSSSPSMSCQSKAAAARLLPFGCGIMGSDLRMSEGYFMQDANAEGLGGNSR